MLIVICNIILDNCIREIWYCRKGKESEMWFLLFRVFIVNLISVIDCLMLSVICSYV